MANVTAPPPGRNGTAKAAGQSTAHPANRRGSSPAAAARPAATSEIPLLVGREEGDFIVYDDVPVWTEHYSRAVGMQFDRGDLERIAARCNERIADTNDYAMLAVRHTSDDPNAEPPPVVGFGGPFHVGTYGKKNPKAAIFAKFSCHKEDRDLVRRHPRVSVEYAYSKNDPKGGYFDVISLLGAEAPELDLGVRYAKRLAADPDLCIGKYSRVMQFVDPEYSGPEGDEDDAEDDSDDNLGDGISRYSADSAPGGSNTFVPSGTGGGKNGKNGKSSKPKKNSQGGSKPGGSGGSSGTESNPSIKHATHAKVNSGDGSKGTTSSATGTADKMPQSGQQSGAPYQPQSANVNYGGAGGNGGGAQAGADSQRSSLSQIDIAQIVAAIQPSIEECVRRIIPSPQPPPVENTDGLSGDLGDGDSSQGASDPDMDGDVDDVADYGDMDADGDGDLDELDGDMDGEDADADSDSDADFGANKSFRNAGGKDGGRDASASATKKPPAGKAKKPPKKERFSMSANNTSGANANNPNAAESATEVARYKKQVADLTAERDEYRAKYEKVSRDASDKSVVIEELKTRVDAIDAERRYNARYSKLMAMQADGYSFDLAEEVKHCEPMSDEEFARHESRARANYQRVPLHMIPMDRSKPAAPGGIDTEEQRARYVKQAQREAGNLVLQAKQSGSQLTYDQAYAKALRQAYEKDGKTVPGMAQAVA